MAHVIVIPYPAQGHVIPLMELSQRLVNQGVRVTFVNTEINHELVTSTWVGKDSFKELMHMVSIPDGLESWEDRSDLGKLTEAILKTMPGKLEELIETINSQGTHKVTCVIADGCAAWAIRVAKKIGTKRAVFWPSSVASLAPALSIKKLTDDGIIDNKGKTTALFQGWLNLIYNQKPTDHQGRFLEGHWQGHGQGKFFGRSANFPRFDRKFLYILCLAWACPGFFWCPCLSALARSTGKIRHC
ncbi:putative trans-zeatin O-beta-D-glucosyltransferase [Helianthus anomalus]